MHKLIFLYDLLLHKGRLFKQKTIRAYRRLRNVLGVSLIHWGTHTMYVPYTAFHAFSLNPGVIKLLYGAGNFSEMRSA